MAETSTSSKQKTKQMIYDGIMKSFEIVVACHAQNCTPRSKKNYSSNFEYIKNSTRDLTTNLYLPYRLDVYLDVDNNNGMSSVLIESWVFHYDNRKRDSKEGRISAVNKHVGILMRTLYCFVRLLPAFQLSTQSSNCPLSFQLYPVVDHSTDNYFALKPLNYHFPPIPTQFGYFSLSLKYLDSQSIKVNYHGFHFMSVSLCIVRPVRKTFLSQYLLSKSTLPKSLRVISFQCTTLIFLAHHIRRHSVATTSANAMPIPDKGNSMPVLAHPELANTWGSYSGELKSPSQKPNDLLRSPSSIPQDLTPPELTRNQSRSADSNPQYLLQENPFGPIKEKDRDRERSISADKERVIRSGRPPQHVSGSS